VNRLVSLLVFISLTSFTSYTFAGGSGQGAAVHTLVIDPGHGGMDPGAIGPGGHHESDLALGVSLKFGEMVHEAFPDVKIIYTRTTDKFVSLADRADMANKAKADLFICIHLNSALNHDAYGTSTYVLGLHRTDDNLEVAKRENAVIELEGDKDKNYEFDPNSPEGHIIMSMKQNAFLDQSIVIASKIEDELAQLSKRKSRGVKQAGFWVLYKTAMPSLLAEIGFISNPSEEQYLATDVGQANIALSLFKAFRAYKYSIEGIKDTDATANQPNLQKKTETAPAVAQTLVPSENLPGTNPPKAPDHAATSQPRSVNLNPTETKKEQKIWQPDTAAIASAAAPKPDTPKAKIEYKPIDKVATEITDTQSIVKHGKVNISPETTQPKTEKKPVPLRDVDAVTVKTIPTADTIVKPKLPIKAKEDVTAVVIPTSRTEADIAKEPAKLPVPKPIAPKETIMPKPVVAKEPAKTIQPKTTVAIKEPAKQAEATPKPPQHVGKDEVYFTVQLLAAKHKPANYDDLVNAFGLIDREDIGAGVVRYMAGEFATFGEAKKALDTAHEKGVKDAFIVGYLNKKRLDGRGTYLLGQKNP
jgi:N-acetylmuramoyl-L-alanine amidase